MKPDPLTLHLSRNCVGPRGGRSKAGAVVACRGVGIEVIADPSDNLPALLRRDTLATLRRWNSLLG